MRDINRLDKFYDELADWQAKTKRDIFFPEEDEMIQIFRDYVSKERDDE